MRFLAIIQIMPDGSFKQVSNLKTDENIIIGNWKIFAEMNVSKPALIKVWNNEHTASFVSGGVLESKGKNYSGKEINTAKLLEIIDGSTLFQEVTDEIPASVKKLLQRNSQIENKSNK
jgi:hypothetical protein